MSKRRPEDEGPRGERERVPEAQPVGGEAWDPLASVRKSISPTQRIQLLKMQVPVLPPEDFMDTAAFQRARAVRSRRFLPLVLGLAGALLVLLLVGLWSRFSSNPDENSRSEVDSVRPRVATLNGAIPSTAEAHLSAQSSPRQPPPSAHDEQPISPQVAATPPKPGVAATPPKPGVAATPPKPGLGPTTFLNSKRQTDTHSVAAARPPKTSTSLTPEPAPSGITFWTQPR